MPVLSLHSDLIQKNSRSLKKQIVQCTEVLNVHIQKQTYWSDRYSDSSDSVQKQQYLQLEVLASFQSLLKLAWQILMMISSFVMVVNGFIILSTAPRMASVDGRRIR